MKITNLWALATAALLGSSSLVYAGALADKQMWDKVDAKVKTSQDELSKSCGGSVSLTIDKSSFKDEDSKKSASWCTGYLNGITMLCKDSAFSAHKAEIVAAVKSVKCHFDASADAGTDFGNKFVKSGTTIEASFNLKSANMDKKMFEFLKKEL